MDKKKTGKLAKKINENSYELSDDTMEEVILPTLREGINRKGALLIIDEIGPIQLISPEFQKLIITAFEDKEISILGTIATTGHPFLEKIHNHIRTELINITEQNRDLFVEKITNEFTSRQNN